MTHRPTPHRLRARAAERVPLRLVADLVAADCMTAGGKRHPSLRASLGGFADTALAACLRAPSDHPA